MYKQKREKKRLQKVSKSLSDNRELVSAEAGSEPS
jgi:hypothetical protein